jgi:hypothetical protein
LAIAFALINAVFWLSLWKMTQDLYQNLMPVANINLPTIFGAKVMSNQSLLTLIYYWHAVPGFSWLPFVWTSICAFYLYSEQWNKIRFWHILNMILISLNIYMINATYMAAVSQGGQCFSIIFPDQQTNCDNLKATYFAQVITLGIDLLLIIAQFPVMYSAQRDVAERLMIEDEKRNLGFAH